MPRVYIIAEAGVNHNGRLDLAIQLCDAAKAAGVDAVKFQTWKTELIIAKNTEMADYQKANLNNNDTQFEMLKKIEMSYENFRIVKDYCDKIGIQFLSTADETESLDFLCDLGIPFIKLGSGDITNIPYLRYCAGKGLPLIISTGMSEMTDVSGIRRTPDGAVPGGDGSESAYPAGNAAAEFVPGAAACSGHQ